MLRTFMPCPRRKRNLSFFPFSPLPFSPFHANRFLPPSLPPSTCSTDLEMPSEEQGKLLSTKICLMQQRFFPCSGARVSGWEQFFFPRFSPNGRAYMHTGGGWGGTVLSLMVCLPPPQSMRRFLHLSAAFSDRVTTHAVLNNDDITIRDRDKMGS